jgi:hypothetical protein
VRRAPKLLAFEEPPSIYSKSRSQTCRIPSDSLHPDQLPLDMGYHFQSRVERHVAEAYSSKQGRGGARFGSSMMDRYSV